MHIQTNILHFLHPWWTRKGFSLPEGFAEITSPYYPLQARDMVVSKGVMVLRGPEAMGFPEVSPYITNTVTQAAIRRSAWQAEYPLAPEDIKEMGSRIRALLLVAAHEKQDTLITGAYGCGAFRNPPKGVAGLFFIQVVDLAMQGVWLPDIVFAIVGSAEADEQAREEFRDMTRKYNAWVNS